MDFLEKLEALKQKGVYSINVHYGEGTGCDDSDVPMLERLVQITGEPVGYLGSLRILFKGSVRDFLDMDLNMPIKNISNPPLREEYQDNGFYFWGSESAVAQVEKQDKVFMM
jgi:hypothetical protein